jgi:hypothetical protein
MNYHILNLNNYKNIARVVYHFSVPDENNSIGINLRTALIQYLDLARPDRVVSIVPNLQVSDITEYNNIVAGVIYEYVKEFKFSNANLSLADKRTEVDSNFTALQITVVDKLRNILSFWGMERNVP